MENDGLGNYAVNKHVSKSFGAQVKRGFNSLISAILYIPVFIRSNIGIAMILGGVTGLFVWEIWNSTLGFNRLFPSRAGFTWIISVSSTLAYLYFHRKSAELIRKAKGLGEVSIAASQALLALISAAVCLYGGFSQVVGDSLTVTTTSVMSQVDKQRLIDQKDKAERVLYNLARPTTDQSLLEDMENRVNEAKGYGFANLDNVEGGVCFDRTKLTPRMNFLCRDASDIRQKQLENEGMWNAVHEQEALIEQLAGKIESVHDTERAMHYQAMERMTSGKLKVEDFAIWGMFLIMLAFWFIGGFLFDDAMEQTQALNRQRVKGAKQVGS